LEARGPPKEKIAKGGPSDPWQRLRAGALFRIVRFPSEEPPPVTHTYTLQRRQFFPRPRDEVFPFFADAGNLQRITPSWLHFTYVTPLPVAMRPGTLIEYQIRLGSIPLRWQTRIEEFDPPRRFVDVQLRGPYRMWHHTHEFQEVEGGTLMIDLVRYQMPLGPLGRLAHALLVRHLLARIFDYRYQVMAGLLGEGSFEHATGTPNGMPP
jgi:ligand-binding SRPBCC domain-containing protein